MTISNTTRKAGPFTGNGVATTFPFTFKVFQKSDVKVLLVDPLGNSSQLILDSDYSVSLSANQDSTPGGSITYPISGAPLPATYELVLLGSLPYDQQSDITNMGGFYPRVIEDMVDRATIQIQQLAEALSRTIAVSETEDAPAVLPAAAGRANMLLGFDALGGFSLLPITTSVGAGDLRNDTFTNGTDFIGGSTTSLTLSRAYGAVSNVAIHFDGVYQGPENVQSLVGKVLTLTAPIPSYVTKVYVTGGTTLSMYLPPAGSVGDGELQWGDTLGRVFASIAALRANKDGRYTRAFVTGYYTPGDGAADDWRMDPADTTTVDDGVTVIVDGLNRRWKSSLGPRVSAKRFGAKCDGSATTGTGTDDTAALTAGVTALAARGGGTIVFPPGGLCRLNGLVVNQPNIHFEGCYSRAGGLLLDKMVQVKQPNFSAYGVYAKFNGTWTGDDFSSGFVVYNKDAAVTMQNFKFLHCDFDQFFFAVAFVGEFDYLAPTLGPQHTMNPVNATTVMWCKSTAPIGKNAGHFQHLMCRNSLVAFNETYNGQNCSSYNFYRDCRNVRIIGNYDDSSAWGGCEVENSPLGNALIMGNNFASTLTTQYASIWVDDSADCRVIGNECTWDILVTCGNVTDDVSGGLYPGEITLQTKAQIQSNTCRGISFTQFSAYVSGSVKADALGNKVTGSLTQGLLTDGKYAGGRIAYNDFSDGTFTYSMNIARWDGLVVNVHDNTMGVAPAFPGTGGIVRAYNNDATFTEQAMRNDNGVAVLGNKIWSTPNPKSFQVTSSSTGTFAFAVPEDVPQYSVTDYRIKLVMRNAGNGDADVVEFNVMVENPSGTPVCTLTALSKRRSNTASNIGIVASHFNKVLLIAVQNMNTGSNTLTVAATAEGMLRL